MSLQERKDLDGYKKTEINTADQGKLIVMLYDGAIRFLRIAMDNMQPQTYDIVNNNIVKSQDIITELILALDMYNGGSIASNLMNIYMFMKKRLLEANIAKDASILEEVSGLLLQIRDAWEEAAAKEKSPSTTRVGSGLSIQG